MRIATDVFDGLRIAAVLDGKSLQMLYARPDDDRPWTGDVFAAKVTRYAPQQRAYFLDMGNGVEAFMPHKDAKAFASTAVLARVERPQTKTKQIRCSFVDTTSAPVGRIGTGDDVAVLAKKDFPHAAETSEGLQGYDAAIVALNDAIVPVRNGLEIVIEHTAAFTAVDVNNADPDLKPFDANRFCLAEVLRQARLRNLSGQILIDCLRLQNPEQRRLLQESLYEAAKDDPRKIDLYGFTRLGLFEMTRERNGLSWQELATL